jgi:FdhD protein
VAKTSKTGTRLWTVEDGRAEPRTDQLATEEPLEIRLLWQGRSRTVALTMRTPGADAELAAGFLFAEGVIEQRERIRGISFPEAAARGVLTPRPPLPSPNPPHPGRGGRGVRTQGADGPTGAKSAPMGHESEGGLGSNVVEIDLGDGPEPQLAPLERHFFATSACGVCGKIGLEALRLRVPGAIPAGPVVPHEVLSSLPGKLGQAQSLFAATGGLHAAALFDAMGNLLAAREDVGRHNALDKLVGWAFLEGRLPLHDHLVLVSGRSSYEILQKCLVAGVPLVLAVSAPSSLAVELAERFGITLVGFLRGGRFNVYSGIERIAASGIEKAQVPRRKRREGLLPVTL